MKYIRDRNMKVGFAAHPENIEQIDFVGEIGWKVTGERQQERGPANTSLWILHDGI